MTRPHGTESRTVNAGEELIAENSLSREFYVLLSGEFRVRQGQRNLGRVTEYGAVIGELGALTGQPRTATVIADVPSEVLVVSAETTSALEKLPPVMEKINEAVNFRFQMIHNKIKMYRSLMAVRRRMLLQETLWENKQHFSPSKSASSGILGIGMEGVERKKLRTTIDDRLAQTVDPDDSKALLRIASEYGIEDSYRERLAGYPWLNERFDHSLHELDQDWAEISHRQDGAAIVRKARMAVAASNLLAEFENLPGIERQMDVVRMESIVPISARVDALKVAYLAKHAEEMNVERQRLYYERRFSMAVQAVKLDAGADVPMVVEAARQLEIEEEYKEQLCGLVAMSGAGTAYVDFSS